MNTPKLALTLLGISVGSFVLSSVCAALAGPQDRYSFPESVAVRYTKALFNTRAVHLSREIDAGSVRTLELETAGTDLQIETIPGSKVKIELEGTYSSDNDDDESLLKSIVEGDRLVVKTDEHEGRHSLLQLDFESSSRSLKLQIPASLQELVMNTVSGDAHLSQLKLRSLQVRSVSGDLNLDGLQTSSLQLKTVSGDARITGDIARVEASSISGDLKLDFANGAPDVGLNTTSGDVQMHFQQAPSVKLEFRTVSGELRVDDSLGSTDSSGRRIEMNLGKGQGRVAVKTVSGDMSVAR